MSKKIKNIRKHNRYFKTFNFTNSNEAEGDEHLESHIQLDEQGNTVLEEKFDAEGELEEKNSFVYNADGKLMEHTLLYAVEDATEKRTLSRDDKGRLLEETKFYGDDSGERIAYVHDEKDNLIERTYYDEEGVFSAREEFKYDEKDSLIEQQKFNSDNKLEGRTTFTQHEAPPPPEGGSTQPSNPTEDSALVNPPSGGRGAIEQCEYDGSGKLLNKTVIKFNEEGKEVSAEQRTADGKLISGTDTVYDEKGNPIERHYKDFYSKTVRYQYDEHNRCIMEELFDGNGVLLRKNMYEYDEDGNIIHATTYEMDTSRGGRDKHFETRYEYEFFPE